MIDAGVPYKKLEEHLYGIDFLLITHIHGDHLNQKTILQIRKMFPNIEIMGNYEVGYLVNLNKITVDDVPVKAKEWQITPFRCTHDVVCQGWVMQKEGMNIIYATDTSTLEYTPKDIKYDYMFIESNHDENVVRQIEGKAYKYGYDAWTGAMRHLSTQKSKGFYYTHRRNKDSKWIELHQSTRFYR